MNNKKKKGIVHTPSIDNNVHKPKETWDLKKIEHFIQTCLDEVYKGEHNRTTFSKKGRKLVYSNSMENVKGNMKSVSWKKQVGYT